MDGYSDDELQALPQTTTVLKTPSLDMQAHTWIQQGYQIIDQCCTKQALAIPYGKMLVRKDGVYDLIDEV